MLIFKVIRWMNLLSTGNRFTEIPLNTERLTQFIGDSGHGKSTFLDAIAFALFNRPFRNINKAGMINSLNNKDCLVELEFEVSGHQYKVRRGIKPNIFEIIVDGTLLNQDAAVKDYQQYLEKNILKFNFKTFKQIVVLGASDFVPFMQLKPVDRRAIIEELLDIEVFSKMSVLLKQKQSELKTSLAENQYAVSITEEKIRLKTAHIASLKADVDQKVKKLANESKEVQKEIKDLDILVADHKTRVDIVKLELVDEPTVNKGFADCSQSIRDFTTQLAEKNKELVFFKTTTSCPTCQQNIDQEFIQKKHNEIQASVATLSKALNSSHAERAEFEKKMKVFQSKRVDLAQAEKELREVENRQREKKSLLQRIVNEYAELKKPKPSIAVEEAELAIFEADVTRLKVQQAEFAQQKHTHDLAANLLKDSGIKALIIKQYLPLINKYVNQFLTSMNFFVTFELDEEFNEKIKSRGRDDFVYANFSEGEKQRIDLALLFAWRTVAKTKNSINTNLLVLDEVLDSYLNQEATENVIEMLRSEVLQDSNIFVISHKDTISDKFDKTIQFKKTNNFSHVV